jgi:hypothetical protein
VIFVALASRHAFLFGVASRKSIEQTFCVGAAMRRRKVAALFPPSNKKKYHGSDGEDADVQALHGAWRSLCSNTSQTSRPKQPGSQRRSSSDYYEDADVQAQHHEKVRAIVGCGAVHGLSFPSNLEGSGGRSLEPMCFRRLTAWNAFRLDRRVVNVKALRKDAGSLRHETV